MATNAGTLSQYTEPLRGRQGNPGRLSEPSDTVAPTVAFVSPAPGSAIGAATPLVFDVGDEDELGSVLVSVEFGALGEHELAFTGAAFTARYAPGSTAVPLGPASTRITLARRGGWPSNPTVHVHAVDAAGNSAS